MIGLAENLLPNSSFFAENPQITGVPVAVSSDKQLSQKNTEKKMTLSLRLLASALLLSPACCGQPVAESTPST